MKLYHFPCLTLFFAVIVYCNLIQAEDDCNVIQVEDTCKVIQVKECCIDALSSRGYDFNFKASYLYWGVQEEQLSFAIENVPLSNPPLLTQAKAKTHRPKWDSGIRLEGSLYNNCNSIGCSFEWINFQTKSNALAQSNQAQFALIPTTIIASSSRSDLRLPCQRAKSQWDININEFTFDLSYLASCGSYFSFCPYVGLMGAILDQKQKITYSGILNSNGAFVDPVITRIDVSISRKNNFHGVGPRFGIDFNWHFCDSLALIAHVNTAYLLGKFNTKNKTSIPSDTFATFLDTNEKMTRGRLMTSGLIGLQWKNQICNCLAVSFSAAYEFQYWWQQWHCMSSFDYLITGEGRWGDLSMNGVVVSGGISF